MFYKYDESESVFPIRIKYNKSVFCIIRFSFRGHFYKDLHSTIKQLNGTHEKFQGEHSSERKE